MHVIQPFSIPYSRALLVLGRKALSEPEGVEK
jgi:hypothetical protein